MGAQPPGPAARLPQRRSRTPAASARRPPRSSPASAWPGRWSPAGTLLLDDDALLDLAAGSRATPTTSRPRFYGGFVDLRAARRASSYAVRSSVDPRVSAVVLVPPTPRVHRAWPAGLLPAPGAARRRRGRRRSGRPAGRGAGRPARAPAARDPRLPAPGLPPPRHARVARARRRAARRRRARDRLGRRARRCSPSPTAPPPGRCSSGARPAGRRTTSPSPTRAPGWAETRAARRTLVPPTPMSLDAVPGLSGTTFSRGTILEAL